MKLAVLYYSQLTVNDRSADKHTHPFNSPFPGLPRWAGTRKVKPIWILLKQETVSGSGISWNICKSAPRSRQITTPAPHHSVFTGRMPFLPPNQQHQSTVYMDIAVRSLTCHTATGTCMPYRLTQCYLPPGRGDIPTFTPAEVGARFSNPGGMQGWVD